MGRAGSVQGMAFQSFFLNIKKNLNSNDLPLKALLLLDNVSGHPKDLQDTMQAKNLWLTIQYIAPNTISLIQPMDQQVIECSVLLT